tara:strand:- start:2063 stop:2485 length:423 start_codon:yes stop_codon:yes gene_type:complete
LNKKFTDKDKKDWENFINSKDKIFNKDLSEYKNTYSGEDSKIIDLHGSSLETANKIVSEYIKRCSSANIKKLVVITGKGLRSNTQNDPYVSKDLSILKYSVPEFIKSNSDLMKLIKEIKEADEKEGGSGAFNIYLKNVKE